MTDSTKINDPGDGTIVVEAPSVEAALAAVAEQVGPYGTIIGAERVSKGGIGGFFSKQTYRVLVRRDPIDDPTPRRFSEADIRSVVEGTAAMVEDAPRSPAVSTQPVSTQPVSTQRVPAQPVSAQRVFAEPEPMAAVDRVLGQVEASETRVVATSAIDSDETLSAQPQTFGEALRAQLQARKIAPVVELAAQPLIDLRATTSEPVAVQPSEVTVDLAEVIVDLAEVTVDLTTAPVPALVSVAAASAAPSGTSAPAPPAPPTATAPGSTQPRMPLGRPLDDCATGTGVVEWSADALSRVGLPYSLIRPLADLDSRDDLAWVFRLSEMVAGMCGPLPTGDVVLAGHDVGTLADRTGLAVTVAPERPAASGSVAIELDITSDTLPYLEFSRAGRALHLHCGGIVEAAPRDVAAVSWSDKFLGGALHVAIETGATLGYIVRADELIRVTPFELALAIRSRLPRI